MRGVVSTVIDAAKEPTRQALKYTAALTVPPLLGALALTFSPSSPSAPSVHVEPVVRMVQPSRAVNYMQSPVITHMEPVVVAEAHATPGVGTSEFVYTPGFDAGTFPAQRRYFSLPAIDGETLVENWEHRPVSEIQDYYPRGSITKIERANTLDGVRYEVTDYDEMLMPGEVIWLHSEELTFPNRACGNDLAQIDTSVRNDWEHHLCTSLDALLRSHGETAISSSIDSVMPLAMLGYEQFMGRFPSEDNITMEYRDLEGIAKVIEQTTLKIKPESLYGVHMPDMIGTKVLGSDIILNGVRPNSGVTTTSWHELAHAIHMRANVDTYWSRHPAMWAFREGFADAFSTSMSKTVGEMHPRADNSSSLNPLNVFYYVPEINLGTQYHIGMQYMWMQMMLNPVNEDLREKVVDGERLSAQEMRLFVSRLLDLRAEDVIRMELQRERVLQEHGLDWYAILRKLHRSGKEKAIIDLDRVLFLF